MELDLTALMEIMTPEGAEFLENEIWETTQVVKLWALLS